MLEIFDADLIGEEDGTINEEVEGIFHEKEACQESRGLMTGILICSVIIIFYLCQVFLEHGFQIVGTIPCH